MTVGAYDALIAAAKKEIGYCNSLKTKISSLNESMSNCVSQLKCTSSNLAQGLVIDGVAQGGQVEAKANTIESFRKSMNATVPQLDARITQLESDIAGWEAAKAALIAAMQAEEEKKNKNIFQRIFGS